MKVSRVSSHLPRSIKYLDVVNTSQGMRRGEGEDIQEGAEDDYNHEYKESESQKGIF